MEDEKTQQHELVQWFDKTYQQRGLKYLRPVEAYAIFLSILSAERGKKILDLACGAGLLLKQAVHKGLHAYGVDISGSAIELARQLVPEAGVQMGKAEALPYADDFFDYVTCIGSLERFTDRQKALQEIKRVTKTDARICLMVRNSRTLIWKIYREFMGFQNKKAGMDAKGLQEWKQLLEQTGFEVLQVYPDHWPGQRWLKWFRGKKNVDFEKIRKPFLPLAFSNEFIFLLRKYEK